MAETLTGLCQRLASKADKSGANWSCPRRGALELLCLWQKAVFTSKFVGSNLYTWCMRIKDHERIERDEDVRREEELRQPRVCHERDSPWTLGRERLGADARRDRHRYEPGHEEAGADRLQPPRGQLTRSFHPLPIGLIDRISFESFGNAGELKRDWTLNKKKAALIWRVGGANSKVYLLSHLRPDPPSVYSRFHELIKKSKRTKRETGTVSGIPTSLAIV